MDSRSFVQRLIDSILGTNDPETVKKKRLKQLSTDLAKSHSNFYKFSSDEVQPTVAKLFYQFYKVIDPAQIFFQSLTNPAAFKNQIINASLTKNQTELMQNLTAQAIADRAKQTPVDQLSETVHKEIDSFVSSFDTEKVASIENTYNTLQQLQAFCTYDFYMVLRKFCPTLKEHTFTDNPPFEAINSKYIKDDLKDFLAVAWPIERDSNWNTVLSFFNGYKETELLQPKAWSQVIARINNLKREHSIEYLIKLAEKDPAYETKFKTSFENVVEPFIDKVKNEAMQAVQKLKSEQKKSKVDNIVVQLFGNESVAWLRNYNDTINPDFLKHKLPTYSMIQPLNYLKAFLLNFVKSDLRSFMDLILVRGQWTSTALAAPMSDAFNELLGISNKITEFDDKLAEDKSIGTKIKTLLPRTLREKDAANIASTLIEDANDEAKSLITTSTNDFVIIGKTIKTVLEDYAKLPRAEIIMNWKELEHFAEEPIKENGVKIYKKIYLFAQLMQVMVNKNI